MTDRDDELGARAELILPSPDLDADLAFFTERLGFAIEAVFPADDPRTARLSGHGLRLCLERGPRLDPPLRLRVAGEERGELAAPCGARIELVERDPPIELPPPEPTRTLVRMSEDAWGAGRAGMLYRDLIPGRQGGRFIASHIRVPGFGPVPDYVHFHKLRFQMIFCLRGSVRLVYEDQGPPFIMRAGDCVLQPPTIRHRVLESFDDLEVLELSCPAEHETWADLQRPLPSEERCERRYCGQRFVFHRAEDTGLEQSELPGFLARDTGIASATEGLASARVLRCDEAARAALSHPGELRFLFVIAGEVRLAGAALRAGDALTLGAEGAELAADRGAELLDVCLPALDVVA